MSQMRQKSTLGIMPAYKGREERRTDVNTGLSSSSSPGSHPSVNLLGPSLPASSTQPVDYQQEDSDCATLYGQATLASQMAIPCPPPPLAPPDTLNIDPALLQLDHQSNPSLVRTSSICDTEAESTTPTPLSTIAHD
ncbi:hypothetical protein SERLA73DRAFT_73631 [Serpula lacrymans var. lacrymans S7.3]|uniref:Uncharacterized protein n=2 Tax=Serpula lacrymans var. lacrymans TaxID=341189 RepID=F8PYU7_SERL3|nr:uncharacterized protein SERLADRAFT_438261 [Serpula lacrymans var. lacrymans S7.9]EGN99060.1 hypothetical protein SERLA73DRAFT_73631 [Serpula lacrymans var. lacrymans S7.3]EGO24636.1 hypothetical protein SERLADRAFT_438261 [Serpula lacrymans var. lacrymans S7.9]